jgi:prephenate dehydratase
MKIGYLGPEGTFTQAAALTAPAAETAELIALPTIFDVIAAVEDRSVDRAVVPIENSQEGSVSATLDALATLETQSVGIIGEVVLPIEQCLISRDPIATQDIEVVISHPQATGQCARFIRETLPQAKVITASSTAEAVRMVSERIRHRWAAIGTRLAAEIYDCTILQAGIEDLSGNATRFVWLAPEGTAPGAPGAEHPEGPWKTAFIFWGSGTGAPGWLVACLSELSNRGVNMTRIESRPRKRALGEYMFFVDFDGRTDHPAVLEALAGLRQHVEVLRVLGSFPAA